MRKLLFLISAGIVCFYSCKTASDNKKQTIQDKKDSSEIILQTTKDSQNVKQDSGVALLKSPEEQTRDTGFSNKFSDTSKREKKIIPEHNSPDQQEIDSLKKVKGKKKFSKE
jgi:hypothetical protein